MSEEKPPDNNQAENGNGNTDILKVKHDDKGKRVWVGFSDQIIWRGFSTVMYGLIAGKIFLGHPAEGSQEGVAALAEVKTMQIDLHNLEAAFTESQADVKELKRAVQKLDVDTGKISQALTDLRH